MSSESVFFTYEDIQRRLGLRDRKEYYGFLSSYSITLLSHEEQEFIEYLYLRRNNYVHNAGRPDEKLQTRLSKSPSPFPDLIVSTEAKKLRTKLRKILLRSYKQVIATVSGG